MSQLAAPITGTGPPAIRRLPFFGSARAFLFGTLGLLGLLQLASSVLVLVAARDDYRRAQTIVLVNGISAHLASVAPDLGTERRRTAAMLRQPNPASRADLEFIAERRAIIGQVLAAAREDLSLHRPELARRLDIATSALAELRSRLDAAFTQPLKSRDATLMAFWTTYFTDSWERIEALADELGRPEHTGDAVFASLNDVRLTATRFRRAYGDVAVAMTAQVAAGGVPSVVVVNELRRLQSRRDELWETLNRQVRLQGIWKLTSSLNAVDTELMSERPRIHAQLIAAWARGEPSPLTQEEYERVAVLGNRSLTDFIGEISNAANEYANAIRSQALTRIAVGMSLLLVSLALIAASVWLVSRRIIAPLESLAAAAGAIAGGREGLQVVEHGVAEVRAVSSQFNRMSWARAEAMRKLSESERRFQTIFQMTPDSTAILSLPDFRYVDVNDEWVREFGLARDKAIGRTFDELGLQRFDSEHATAAAPMPTLASSMAQHEIWLTSLDKGLQAYEISARQIEVEGRVYLLRQVRNITERKRAESELLRLNRELEQRVSERTAALSESLKEMESFAYSVSHDLRAPLRHIDGFSSILMAEENAALGENGRQLLGRIGKAAVRMGALIDDLLTFSRTGRQALSMNRVETARLIEEAREQIAPEGEGRNIEWTVAPLPPVAGDAALLRQVWINLLSNAVKFTRGRDPARIEIGTLPGEDGLVTFYVRDNGAGFDARYTDKLFGVFQRLHPESEFEGTGIGLAIVARVLQRHGGRAWAEGEVGKGATFFFQLMEAGESLA